MKIKHLISLIIIFVLVSTTSKGQNPLGLYFMETIPQLSHVNPAMQPRAHGYMALPSVNQIFQSDLAFKDVFQDVGTEWVSPLSNTRFDFDKLYKVTGKAVTFNESFDVGIWGLGFRSGRDYITFSLNIKNVTQLGVPADFIKIAEIGFPGGEVYDFSTMRVKQILYKEMHIGYSRDFSEKLTFGINLKPLWGMVAGYTDINTFRLETSRQVWQVHVDGNVHTSAPLEVEEGEPGDFPESIEGRELEDNDIMRYFSEFKNPGIALDFGAVYRFNKRWTFSAALVNLGYINWKEDLNSLSFKGSYSFEGVVGDASNKDNLEEEFEAVIDALKEEITYETGHDKFRTPLTPMFYAGASWNLTPSVSFGMLSRSIMQKDNFRQDFSLSTNLQPYSFIAFNLNYSLRTSGGSGVGTGLSLLLGPMQLYFLADYLPMHYANVYFDDKEDSFPIAHKQKELAVKVGLNLIFGRHGFRDRPMLTVID